MKKGTLKTILFAALACIFMGGALLAGMHLYAASVQNTQLHEAAGTETAESLEDETEKDAPWKVLPANSGEGAENGNGREPDYSKVLVIDKETKYHLTGYDYEDGKSPMGFRTEEKPRENEISREEAALKGLKEIYRIFGEKHMEEMTLELGLYRDTEMEEQGSAKESIWAGQQIGRAHV